MLYLETSDGFVPWNGQIINGIIYPRDIAHTWSAEDLAAIGLYEPLPADGVPEGKYIVSTSVQRVEGEVKFVHELDDIPEPPAPTPETHPLSMRQLRLGLLLNGFSVTFIQDIINEMEDPIERSIAQIWYEETNTVEWNHPMTQSLMAAAGINETNARTMWLQALQLEA